MFRSRSHASIVLMVFLALFILVLLVGQTSALISYDFAVSLGLQESEAQVTPFGVAVNEAFAAGDSFVYIPILFLAFLGLLRRRRWALPLIAAAMGISIYWTVTVAHLLLAIPDLPGCTLEPGIDYVVFLGVFFLVGLWGLGLVLRRGEGLIGDRHDQAGS